MTKRVTFNEKVLSSADDVLDLQHEQVGSSNDSNQDANIRRPNVFYGLKRYHRQHQPRPHVSPQPISLIDREIDQTLVEPFDFVLNDNIEAGYNNEQTNIRKLDGLPEQIMPLPEFNNWNLFWYCLGLSITSFPLGWDVGTITNLINHSTFTIPYLSSFKLGMVISSFILGSLFGCFIIPPYSSKVTLKLLLQVSTGIYLIGSVIEWIFLQLTINYWGFIIGRLICGISCGSLGVLGPLYMNELLMAGFQMRGFYLSFWQTFVCFIILIGNILNYYLNFYSYNLILIHQIIKITFVAIINGVIFIIPHSPNYFQIKGNLGQLSLIYSKVFLINDPKQYDVITLFQHKQFFDENGVGNKSDLGYSDLFKKYPFKVTKCCLIMAFQQLTGINYFFYYGPVIFKNIKLAFIFMSLANLVGSLLSGPIIQLWNIKSNLILNSIVMSIAMICYSLIGQFTSEILPLIILSIIFIFSFAVSWGPSTGILVNIIANNNSKILSLSIGINWLINWIITMITPSMIQLFQFNYGWLFIGSLIAMTIFITIFIPKNILLN